MDQPAAKKRRLAPKTEVQASPPHPPPFPHEPAPPAQLYQVQEAPPPPPERHEFESFARHLQDAAMLIYRQTQKSPYTKTSVLILRWEEDNAVEHDLASLDQVLCDRYNYRTERFNIPTGLNPSVKLGVCMASFLENAAPDHLLIIYYAGMAMLMRIINSTGQVGSVSVNKASAKDVEDGRMLLEAREVAASTPVVRRHELPSHSQLRPETPIRLESMGRLDPMTLPQPSGTPGIAYASSRPGTAISKNDVEDSAEMQEAAEQLKALSHVRPLSSDNVSSTHVQATPTENTTTTRRDEVSPMRQMNLAQMRLYTIPNSHRHPHDLNSNGDRFKSKRQSRRRAVITVVIPPLKTIHRYHFWV
ncbi:hypothetical protein GL218_05574 [Daldinia childiae]|uniref:uncharacterized protein n=1 Tax=Daldinia childiae TaxID=326645 RepID=UPI001447DB34|nr:uncharacterized protein GL218_05574 [Daldinia childiae]KAF3057959.1 hypothetical protein GL218_05574 [Daldinia childiae]